MINDGYTDLEYSLSNDHELNVRLSSLLNELCHVFRMHPDGHWKSLYKPKYTKLMALEIKSKPFLIKQLLALKDPVVSNITHAAIEFNKNT
ncbi:hypothetical protein RI845_07245 [Thalassotalea nanhaiensis]|uniref:Uncharacterized protein n=1 Tax=Thalassotalea nanhaiensis TaxID=3065648 RepID=A0ABY9TMZ6_9GAMM|nr:hypothetical protein RI845_07245 [Colwelliaceae bacterium SQ345]